MLRILFLMVYFLPHWQIIIIIIIINNNNYYYLIIVK